MGKFLSVIICISTQFGLAQSNNNGKLDLLSEFTTISTIPFTMPDGVRLMTDVYLPITSDHMTVDIDYLGNTYNILIIPKGTQLFVYDSLNGGINPNKYQLPLIFTRTPYNKGMNDEIAIACNILGYAYALQDMRGRYQSEGVYIPMYSDGWNKNAYHPGEPHALDITDLSDPHNANNHEDGRNSLLFIKDSLYKDFDLNSDGVPDTNAPVYNGSIVMFGASALGNSQYQAAAAIKNDVAQKGLKGLIPIVATGEYYNSTLQNNGVFRRELMAGWIDYQMQQVVKTNPADKELQNDIHSNYDYGLLPSNQIIEKAIDQYTVIKDNKGFTAMYPNYLNRGDMDISAAPVDENGEPDANGAFSRYENLELPMYHLTGWWDIFIDGQIDTYNKIMKHTGPKTRLNQKLVIGPWTHGTIGQDTVTDQVFPPSVFDLRIMGNFGKPGADRLAEVFKGEVAMWMRYLLNYAPENNIGEPKVLIPESRDWQSLGSYTIRLPSKEYYITYTDFLNYLTGHSGLKAVPVEIKQGSTTIPYTIDIPADESSKTPGSKPFENPVVPAQDFSKLPNVRFYVPGPVNDGIEQNKALCNIWTGSDEFPLVENVQDYNLFLHSDGRLDTKRPELPEAPLTYVHDPDEPVLTVGGGNLFIPTPKGDRLSAGPMNYADPGLAPFTMDRPDVLKFETGLLGEALTIIGIPRAKIYVSSTPDGVSSGKTDTDFFMRVLDVYPDGREHFVVEGAVNARARDYVKSLAQGQEDINLPYSNINIGQTYELEFNLLPIAYCFGTGHKIKVLLSSSNWPRYQSNPNLPIANGEFFRREPKDGKSYTFEGEVLHPRKATQKLFFSPDEPTHVIFPRYTGKGLGKKEKAIAGNFTFDVFPNPASDWLNLSFESNGKYNCRVYNMIGQEMISLNIIGAKEAKLNLKDLPGGVYAIVVTNQEQQKEIRKVILH